MKLIIIVVILSFLCHNIFGQQNIQECELIFAKAKALFTNGDYQLAIKKITAYKLCCIPKEVKKADSFLLKIFATINQQKNNAIKAKNEADKLNKVAIKEKDVAKANYCVSEAKSFVDKDPTTALRLLEVSLKLKNDKAIFNYANEVYINNAFYKIIFKYTNKYYCKSNFFIGLDSFNNTTNKNRSLNVKNANNQMDYSLHPIKFDNSVFSFDKKHVVSYRNFNILAKNKFSKLVIENIDSTYEITINGFINDVCFSKITHDFVVCTDDSIIYRYDTTGEIINEYKGHKGPVTSASFSQDGNYIVTGSADWTVRLWSLDGICLHTYKRRNKYISSVAFSPNGNSILYGSWDNTATLIDTTGFELAELSGHTDRVTSVSFSENGNLLLTGSIDSTAILWDLDGNLLQKLKGHTDRVTSVAFCQNDEKVITTSYDQTVRSWNIHKLQFYDYENSSLNYSFALSKDNKYILATSIDSTARIYNSEGKTLFKYFVPSSRILSVDISYNNEYVLTGLKNGTAILWNKEGNIIQLKDSLGFELNYAKFSPNGKFVILANKFENGIVIWDLISNSTKKISNIVSPVSFSKDESFLIAPNYSSFDNDNINKYSLKNGFSEKIETRIDDAIDFDYLDLIQNDNTIIIGSESSNYFYIFHRKNNFLRKIEYKSYSFSNISVSNIENRILTIGTDKFNNNFIMIFDLFGHLLNEINIGKYNNYIFAKFSLTDKIVFIDIQRRNSIERQLIKWTIPSSLMDFLKFGWLEQLNNELKNKYSID